jgi:peroxiredoxin
MSYHRSPIAFLSMIFAFMWSASLVGCASSKAHQNPNMQGLQEVIQTEFATIQGPRESLASYSGKIVLLHFFASWCPDCAQEAPSLRNLDAALKGSDFQIIGVSIDNDPFEARAFAQRFRLPFPIIVDPEGDLKQYFSIKEVPTTIFLDRMGVPVTLQDPDTGVVTAKLVGARRWDTERPVEMIAGMIEAR